MVFRVCFVTLLVWAALSTPAAVADTLADALTRAVANLPEVRAAHSNQRAIEESTAQARGEVAPQI